MATQKKINKIVVFLTLFLVATFPVYFLYLNNIEEVSFLETITPAILLSILPIISYLFLLFLKKLTPQLTLILIITTITFVNFKLVEKGMQKIFPRFKYWHVLLIILFILFHLYYLIHKFISDEFSGNLIKIILIVVSSLLLLNLIMSLPSVINKIKFSSNSKNNFTQSDIKTNPGNGNNPNVYLLIFDEYASFNQISKYYGYDNSELDLYFKENNFSNSLTSSNDSEYTTVVMTNILSLDIVCDDDTSTTEKDDLRHSGQLLNIFRENGYTIYYVGNGKFYGGEDAAINNQGGNATISGESFSTLILNQTVGYPIMDYFSNKIDKLPDRISLPIDYMLNANNIKKEPSFVLFHIDFPHAPFLVDSKGNQISRLEQQNWADKSYYLEQYKYATKVMMNILDVIIKNDPNAIIIVQSDHGARATSNPNFVDRDFEEKDVLQILNAVYYAGEPLEDIHGKSGINTMRTVLNHLFGTDFEMIEESVNEDDQKNKN